MSKLILCLDVDGVLADFVGGVLDESHRRTGRAHLREEWRHWHWPEATLGELFFDICRGRGFCAGLAPFPEALEWVPRLREVADVRFVTSPMRGEHWRPERQAWLQRHFGARPEDVTQVKDKHLVTGDVLVDDKADNVRKWKWGKLVGRRRGLLWDAHHNRADADLDSARVREWQDVYELVCK